MPTEKPKVATCTFGKCRKGFRNAGKVLKCKKDFKNARKVLKRQERF